jgi:hypothetical protein
VRDFGDVRAWPPEAKLLGVEGEGAEAVWREEANQRCGSRIDPGPGELWVDLLAPPRRD